MVKPLLMPKISVWSGPCLLELLTFLLQRPYCSFFLFGLPEVPGVVPTIVVMYTPANLYRCQRSLL